MTLAAVGPRRGCRFSFSSSPCLPWVPFYYPFPLLPRVELCTPTCFLSLDCKAQTVTLVTCKPKAYNTPLLVRMHKQLPAPAVGTALSVSEPLRRFIAFTPALRLLHQHQQCVLYFVQQVLTGSEGHVSPRHYGTSSLIYFTSFAYFIQVSLNEKVSA